VNIEILNMIEMIDMSWEILHYFSDYFGGLEYGVAVYHLSFCHHHFEIHNSTLYILSYFCHYGGSSLSLNRVA
jgi:hypothetical protein